MESPLSKRTASPGKNPIKEHLEDSEHAPDDATPWHQVTETDEPSQELLADTKQALHTSPEPSSSDTNHFSSSMSPSERRAELERLAQSCVSARDLMRKTLRSIPAPLARPYRIAAETRNYNDFGISARSLDGKQLQRCIKIASTYEQAASKGKIPQKTRAEFTRILKHIPPSTPSMLAAIDELTHALTHARQLRGPARTQVFGNLSLRDIRPIVHTAQEAANAWRNSTQALATLWRPWLVAIALKIYPWADQDDLAQETWLCVQRSLDLYQRHSDASALTYAYAFIRLGLQIGAKNHALLGMGTGLTNTPDDATRSDLPGQYLEQMYESLTGTVPDSVIRDPLGSLARYDRVRILNRLLHSLNPGHAAVLKAFYGLDDGSTISSSKMSYSELAHRFGYSRQRAQVVVQEARDRLRAILENDREMAISLQLELDLPTKGRWN